MSYKIRSAGLEDCSTIISMIQELADYENFPDGPKLTVDDLRRDGFGKNPLFYCFLAESEDETEKGKFHLAGYAFYYNTYATFTGKGLYLEDLYVKERYRKNGIGSALWNAVIEEILKNNYGRLHFSVLNWNSPSIDFYEKRGAKDATLAYGWIPHRIMRNVMENIEKLNLGYPEIPCKIRLATASDCDVILSLIKEFATILGFSEDAVKLTVNDLKRDGFGETPAFYVLVAECSKETEKGHTSQVVGQILYYFTYSTWLGKAFYLEDFFVKEEYRGKGIGTALWKALIQEALKNDCCRIDFSSKEQTFDFYRKRGATDMEETEDWHFFCLTQHEIEKCRKQLPSN